MIQDEMIMITQTEYDELLDRVRFLEILEGYGVENWDAWDLAVEDYQAETEE